MALAGIGKRRTPKKIQTPPTIKSQKMKQRAQPLFDVDSDEDLPMASAVEDDDDTIMQLALQESLESQENADLEDALEASRNEFQGPQSADTTAAGSSLEVSDGDELYVPGRLETALAIANAGPTPKSISMARRLSSSFPEVSVSSTRKLSIDHPSPSPDLSDDSLEYLDEVNEATQAIPPIVTTPKPTNIPLERVSLPSTTDGTLQAESVEEQAGYVSDSDEDMEPVSISIPDQTLSEPTTTIETSKPKDTISTPGRATKVHFDDDELPTGRTDVATIPSPESSAQHPAREPIPTDSEKSEEEHVISDWSRSPSPVADGLHATEAPTSNAATVEDSWDAAQEMDAHAEEGEFARFLSQVKGKDLDDVRREIDEEIKSLNQQKKAAMRDSEDITQQMIAQIMVRFSKSFLSSKYSLLPR